MRVNAKLIALNKVNQNKVIVEEGKKAFKSGFSPDHCPYINKKGDNAEAIVDWINGWGLAYRKSALNGWAPAFKNGTVVGSGLD